MHCDKVAGKFDFKKSGPFGYMAASLKDGLVDSDKTVEIKCLPRYEGRLANALANDKDKD